MARSSSHDLREYRRGMVLGLTLAETLLLMLFLLLMAVAALLMRSEERERTAIDGVTEARGKIDGIERELRPLMEALERQGLPPGAAGDFAQRLDEARQIRNERDLLRRELSESQANVQNARQQIERLQTAIQRVGAPSPPPEDVLSPFSSIDPSRPPIEVRDELVALLRRQPEAGTPGAVEALAAKIEQAQQLARDLQAVRDRALISQRQADAQDTENERLRRELARRGGSGALYPSCLIAGGQAEAVFEIILRTNGEIEVRDLVSAERQRGTPWTLLGEFPRGTPIPIETFLTATRQFSAWSTQQRPECRFQVNVRRHPNLNNAPASDYLRVIGPLGNAASNHLPFYRVGG
jgi:hypothetical protein